jgi:putative ABC transport system substrate-binding protein
MQERGWEAIPIVALEGDMLRLGFVNSLARPNGNITGVSFLADENDGKRQDILIEAVPGLRLMAVLADITYTNAAKLDALQAAARARNVELSIDRITRGEEIAAALDSAQASGAKALNVLVSALLWDYLIMEYTAAAHLPTMYALPETAEEGGFAGYGAQLNPLFFRGNAPTGYQTLPRHQGCRHPRRTAHQVRVGDQSQDR